MAPAEELPARILAYRKHAPQLADDGDGRVEETSKSLIENVIVLIRTHTGNDFSLYKRSTLEEKNPEVERQFLLRAISAYERVLAINPETDDPENDPHYRFEKNWPQVIHGKNAPRPAAAAQK